MAKSKFDDPTIEERVRTLLQRYSEPVSIDLVAYNLKLGWGTARSTLLNMALKGDIRFLKTSKSFVFWFPKGAKKESCVK